MSISSMMRTATSGMAAQGNRLSTVSDNIANASTTGYKRAFTEFSSMVLESGGAEYTSGSVTTDIRYGISKQGSFDYTTSKTDLAIDGGGFFLVQDETGASYMTRSGSFVKNGAGDLINAGGYKLMGYPVINGNVTASANGTAGLQPVNIATEALEAVPTTTGTFAVNLPSTNTTVVAAGNLPSANAATGAYTQASSLVVFDNTGAEKLLDVYFTRTALGDSTAAPPVPDTWEMAVFDHSGAASGSTPFPYASGALSTSTLSFLAGKPDTSSPTSMSIAVPNGSTMTLDISKITQLPTDYQVITATTNGSKPSAVDHVEFSSDGTLYSVYGNGMRSASYRIPLATVAAPDNLTPLAGNVYTVSSNSGDLQVGFAGTSQFGTIKSSTLEKSTVDTASELTTMIESQFSFTANSKVFQTAGELMQVLVDLKR